MKDEKRKTQYRIGEFAHRIGVTPDFLKHYEDAHLINSVRSENGYRYFAFEQTPRVFECIRLRNFGVPVREMGQFFHDLNGESGIAALDGYTVETQKRILRDTVFLEEHQRIKNWLALRREKPTDWEVVNSEGYYFLPHSNGKFFLEDERIYEIVGEWMSWIPIVKSVAQFNVLSDSEEAHGSYCWGLGVSEPQLKRLGLPINGAVQYVPPAKSFLYHYAEEKELKISSFVTHRDHPFFRLLDRLGLEPKDEGFREICMTVRGTNTRKDWGIFHIPLKDSSERR